MNGLLSAYESLEASFDGTAAIKLSGTNKDKGFAWTELIEELSDSLEEPVVVETPSSEDFTDYDCTIVLSHFRSHDTAGFNGAVKQTAIISNCFPLVNTVYMILWRWIRPVLIWLVF